jgi:GMP synthase-like glutamine amidotransferase
MPVVALRHIPIEGAGRIESVLAARGIGLEYADLYRPGAPTPDISKAAGLIVMGGPMSVNDPLPWLREEERLIGQAMGLGRPVLGICLGAQLIAKTLGAKVYRNPVKEIGWYDISFTSDARRDPLFGGLPETEAVFHWHGETFDLPAGAVLLASSDACRNQGFRVGNTVYGLQFHLEVTPEMIADWCRHDENCGDVRELKASLDPVRDLGRLTELADLVFGRWCDVLDPELTF